MDKVTRQCPQTTTFLKRKESRSGIEPWSYYALPETSWFSVALRPQRRVGGLLGTGTEWERGERVKGSTAETARKRPERPWTAARTMEVGVPSPLPSDLCTAQLLFQLLCWTESLRQCPLHRCWRTTWTTRSKRRPTCSAQLHLSTHDLFWAKVRVQLHFRPLRSLDLLISPGTMKPVGGPRQKGPSTSVKIYGVLYGNPATQSVSSRLTRDWLTWNWSSQSELRGKLYAKYLIFLPKSNLNQLLGNRKKGLSTSVKTTDWVSCVLYGKPATVRSWLEADFDLLKLRIESELRGLTA